MSSSPSQLSDAPVADPEFLVEDETPVVVGPVEGRQTSLYRILWRWHFYAGMIVSPVLLIASITGAIYVFQSELSDWMYADMRFVEPGGERLSVDEQVAIATKATGGMEPEYLAIYPGENRSSQFIAHRHEGGHENPDQQHLVCFVDPYTGKVLGTYVMEQEFFNVVLAIHRNLFAGAFGRVIVELATSWGLILLLTGLVLWWPRKLRAVRGVWWPRLKAKPYVVLRDLHSVFGFYLLGFAAIVLATGLFVSQVWGVGFFLVSDAAGQSLMDFFARAESTPPTEKATPAPLDTAVASVLKHRREGDMLQFELHATPDQAWKAYLMHDADTNTVRGYDIDQYTGQLLSVTETSELTPMVKILALAVSLHQGKTWGMPSKIAAFVTCLGLVAMIITGIWMWWQRRPRGTWGLPQKPRSAIVPKWVWLIVACLGIALPTVGVSILLILAGDWIVRRVARRRMTRYLASS